MFINDPEQTAIDRHWMRMALAEASEAVRRGEVPVGAVIISGDRLLGRAHNQREQLLDPTAHAEMIALTQAAEALQNWRLTGATLYVTLEPCAMCAGALVLGRVDRLVFGAVDPKAGACGSLFDITCDPRLNHRIVVDKGVLAEECGAVLKEFFAKRRKKSNPTKDSSS